MSWSALYVIGASGHGKVVADVCQRAGLAELRGFIDDSAEMIGQQVLGLPVLGNSEWLEQQARNARVAVALGVGDGKRRRNVVQRCRECDIEVVTVVHPSATWPRARRSARGPW